MKYPVERGIITNFDDFERLLHHLFYNLLRIAPEEEPCCFIEPVGNPDVIRQKIVSTFTTSLTG
jgi:actin-related protein